MFCDEIHNAICIMNPPCFLLPMSRAHVRSHARDKRARGLSPNPFCLGVIITLQLFTI
jgi:hypothetical protein